MTAQLELAHIVVIHRGKDWILFGHDTGKRHLDTGRGLGRAVIVGLLKCQRQRIGDEVDALHEAQSTVDHAAAIGRTIDALVDHVRCANCVTADGPWASRVSDVPLARDRHGDFVAALDAKREIVRCGQGEVAGAASKENAQRKDRAGIAIDSAGTREVQILI